MYSQVGRVSFFSVLADWPALCGSFNEIERGDPGVEVWATFWEISGPKPSGAVLRTRSRTASVRMSREAVGELFGVGFREGG